MAANTAHAPKRIRGTFDSYQKVVTRAQETLRKDLARDVSSVVIENLLAHQHLKWAARSGASLAQMQRRVPMFERFSDLARDYLLSASSLKIPQFQSLKRFLVTFKEGKADWREVKNGR